MSGQGSHPPSSRGREGVRAHSSGEGPALVFRRRGDPQGPVTHASENVTEVLGYRPEELTGRPASYSDLVHPEDIPRVTREIEQKLQQGYERFALEPYRIRRADREYRWVHDLSIVERAPDGRIDAYRSHLVDITERMERELELRLLATPFHVDQSIFITDPEGRILRVNPAFRRTTGFPAEACLQHSPLELLRPACAHGALLRDILRQTRAAGSWSSEVWIHRRSGEALPIHITLSAIHDEAGRLEHYVGVFYDISHQKALEKELERQAFYDQLTGIANRRHFESLLTQEIRRAERYGTPVCLALVDVDHFKTINDAYGHEAGDEILQSVVHALQARLREADVLSRWGGEEFTILLPETHAEQAQRLAESLRAFVEATPLPTGGHVTISLGLAQYRPGETTKDLLKRSDEALYRAKRLGRNCVVRY
ncbi:sensor domain-containing diguanylate cyclase [Halorhodospira neutriphila]|nr:GGDEF domain-containing protein [Halorhodospira neutriphila]